MFDEHQKIHDRYLIKNFYTKLVDPETCHSILQITLRCSKIKCTRLHQLLTVTWLAQWHVESCLVMGKVQKY